MTKTLKRKVITPEEFRNVPEDRKRMFTVSYKEMYGILRIEKTFQKKEYVYKLLNNPNIHNIKIIQGDVINE